MGFKLPKDDLGFLEDSFRGKWETIVDEVERGILIKNYFLPEGYKQLDVEMMILVPQNYPMAALDMFYVSPDIAKVTGNNIVALSNESHFSKRWQRWSRHYQWEAGIHNIATHLQVVKNALEDG